MLQFSLHFIRNFKVKGLAAKVNPSGKISLVVEVKHKRKSIRNTLGSYSVLSVSDARAEALRFIYVVKFGV